MIVTAPSLVAFSLLFFAFVSFLSLFLLAAWPDPIIDSFISSAHSPPLFLSPLEGPGLGAFEDLPTPSILLLGALNRLPSLYLHPTETSINPWQIPSNLGNACRQPLSRDDCVLLAAYWIVSVSRHRQQKQPTARSLARRGFVSAICLVWLRRYSCTITAYKPHPLPQQSASPLAQDGDESTKGRKKRVDRVAVEQRKKKRKVPPPRSVWIALHPDRIPGSKSHAAALSVLFFFPYPRIAPRRFGSQAI
ncbi:hypothetical protein P170DRAFT_64982 [Aspergillus steynii IBT 23096]|uniref:Uncharacterized protein n=1 Tax=Aspergillus steynii IBT 23096 TaxID=1392250 RepID=A0A2I2FTL4_9EURO|nr:uncharacterized protein P170DRAFT_64982 [Aspergillus steynii IBT 23096]PLB43917.1 hypothetical protein P170DRAFT_64982 [Aspergillus steynii IBT 23096]